jgi:hypothetical protein
MKTNAFWNQSRLCELFSRSLLQNFGLNGRFSDLFLSACLPVEFTQQ